jgi:cell volume regulation protein A
VHDTLAFGALVLAVSAAALLAVQSHGLTVRLRVPAPAVFLVAAAVLAAVLPGLEEPDHRAVERLVTVALVVILFDGGLHIGLSRFREAAATVLSLGVLGTFATVLGAALVAHLVLGGSWYVAVLVATAIAPTDPAVVFSVLGQREVEGRSGTVLEGESGANDPVGIALMAALLSAGGLSAGALGHVAGTFALQMVVGLAVGVLGARLLLLLMRRSPLPAEGLYPVRTLVAAGVLFGVATVAHGSGFLAVFVAGILLGDERAPYKREVERFHSALASLAEVVAFACLGLTVHLDVLARTDVWVPGLVLAVVLALVVRPLLNGPLLLPARLSRGESAFVLLAGLKGAVPLLLGSLLVPLPGGERLYGVVVVVVLLSVVVQGGSVPLLARLLHVRMRVVEQEPFSLGVRLRDEPQGAHRLGVAAGSLADGRRVEQVPGIGEGTWISLLIRDHALLPVRGDTVLRAGDELLLLVDEEQDAGEVCRVFTAGA